MLSLKDSLAVLKKNEALLEEPIMSTFQVLKWWKRLKEPLILGST